jgi:hypothetical protein
VALVVMLGWYSRGNQQALYRQQTRHAAVPTSLQKLRATLQVAVLLYAADKRVPMPHESSGHCFLEHAREGARIWVVSKPYSICT